MKYLVEVKNQALGFMESAGFTISEAVTLDVDEKLPFMGYTTEKDGKPHIVISKWALKSNMLIGLLIHELSHIYRTETNHPSHNYELHEKVLQLTFAREKPLPYQLEVVRNSINSIQDLYADDISYKAFERNIKTNLTDFFLSWIHTPIKESSKKDLWINAGYVVSTAFANANLQRHHVIDIDGKIEKATVDFLSHSTPKMIKGFRYFKEIMVTLPEKITDEEFGAFLVEYLKNLIAMT